IQQAGCFNNLALGPMRGCERIEVCRLAWVLAVQSLEDGQSIEDQIHPQRRDAKVVQHCCRIRSDTARGYEMRQRFLQVSIRACDSRECTKRCDIVRINCECGAQMFFGFVILFQGGSNDAESV